MTDLISRADAIEAVRLETGKLGRELLGRGDILDIIYALPSADAEPKWNCTANFVAEQLDRLRDMTDEERWDFFIKFFIPSAEAVQVVRCKDCRWWSGSVNTSHNNHLCKRALDQNVEYWVRSDDYCSYGERREESEVKE